MDTKERIICLEKNLARQQDWIKTADAKTAPIIFISASMLGTTAAFLSKSPELSGLTLFLSAVCVLSLIGTLYSMLMVNLPRISYHEGSFIFFEDIKRRDYSVFEKQALELKEENYFRDLTRACYESALIASDKFRYLRRATLFLFAAILPWSILVYNILHYYKMDNILGN